MVDREYDERLEKVFSYDMEEENTHNSSINQAYGYSNEDLERLFKKLDVAGKSVLTVGSSGDQVLNSIYYGAKDVTLIDANPYAIPVVELKLASIKNLSYDEFMNYWYAETNLPDSEKYSERILDDKIYARISHDLSPQSKMFWDTIMLEKGENNFDIVRQIFHSPSFKRRENTEGQKFPVFAYGSEFYRDEAHYNILKQRLAKCPVDYIEADIMDSPSILEKKYDRILLSNIYDYMTGSVNRYCDIINTLEADFLNEGGKMQLHYNLMHNHHNAYFDFLSYLNNKNISTHSMFNIVESDQEDSKLVEKYYKSGKPLSMFRDTCLYDKETGNYDRTRISVTSTIILDKEMDR